MICTRYALRNVQALYINVQGNCWQTIGGMDYTICNLIIISYRSSQFFRVGDAQRHLEYVHRFFNTFHQCMHP
jgi:hypothetical protein